MSGTRYRRSDEERGQLGTAAGVQESDGKSPATDSNWGQIEDPVSIHLM